jgi:hypothetical protein
MNAPNANAAARGLRRWWASPPRTGMRRLINPIAYRHPHALSRMHILGGGVAAIPVLICLAYAAYGWAAFFLVISALNLAAGYWYITIARESPSRS